MFETILFILERINSSVINLIKTDRTSIENSISKTAGAIDESPIAMYVSLLSKVLAVFHTESKKMSKRFFALDEENPLQIRSLLALVDVQYGNQYNALCDRKKDVLYNSKRP